MSVQVFMSSVSQHSLPFMIPFRLGCQERNLHNKAAVEALLTVVGQSVRAHGQFILGFLL